MAILGLGIVTIAACLGFGLLIGILFGFFGMGGSLLVTPALLVWGYPATVAVGSGLAFVFGTSVIGAIRHRAHARIDYHLAAVMLVGMSLGVEVGKRLVFRLDALGSADVVVSGGYVGLLGAVGLFLLWEGRADDAPAGPTGIATAVRAVTIPPMVPLSGGATVSVWSVLAIGLGIGGLSGCLGIGGGFLLVPVLMYGFGIPAAVAVGTSTLQIMVSGAVGTFGYALANAVDVPVVAALLGGSALGARIGAGATGLVDETAMKGYFAVMLLAAGVAAAGKQASTGFGIVGLDVAGAAVIVGTVVLVSGAIVRASVATLRTDRGPVRPPTA